jgi:DNA-binding NtrC family response regulator
MTDAARVKSALIVDDERGIRELLKRWLQKAGYDTAEAASADEALAKVAAQDIDVVLCDIEMPGHDGLWLIARLREQFPDVAIVLATGLDTVPAIVSLRSGVVEYIVKPFEQDLVMTAMRRAVRWREKMAARPAPQRSSGDDWVGAWLSSVGD